MGSAAQCGPARAAQREQRSMGRCWRAQRGRQGRRTVWAGSVAGYCRAGRGFERLAEQAGLDGGKHPAWCDQGSGHSRGRGRGSAQGKALSTGPTLPTPAANAPMRSTCRVRSGDAASRSMGDGGRRCRYRKGASGPTAPQYLSSSEVCAAVQAAPEGQAPARGRAVGGDGSGAADRRLQELRCRAT